MQQVLGKQSQKGTGLGKLYSPLATSHPRLSITGMPGDEASGVPACCRGRSQSPGGITLTRMASFSLGLRRRKREHSREKATSGNRAPLARADTSLVPALLTR